MANSDENELFDSHNPEHPVVQKNMMNDAFDVSRSHLRKEQNHEVPLYISETFFGPWLECVFTYIRLRQNEEPKVFSIISIFLDFLWVAPFADLC